MKSHLITIDPPEILLGCLNLKREKESAREQRGLDGAKNLFCLILILLLSRDGEEPWPIYGAHHLE
jgi:hypothetical protein